MANFYARYNGGLFGGGGGGGGGGTAPLADKVALSASATNTAVVFGTAFSAAPVVVAWLTSSTPDNSPLPMIGSTPTTTGFTAYYGTSIPDGTYTLHWIASAVND